jgi:hypothetical protein
MALYCNTYGNYSTTVLQIAVSLQEATIAILYRGGLFISPPKFILNAVCCHKGLPILDVFLSELLPDRSVMQTTQRISISDPNYFCLLGRDVQQPTYSNSGPKYFCPPRYIEIMGGIQIW